MLSVERQFLREVRRHGADAAPLALIRHFPRWKRTLAEDFSLLDSDLPWMNFHAVQFLREVVRPGAKVFEYGGGASTLFLLRRGAQVETVEHDAEWFETLSTAIEDRGMRPSWRGHFVPPEQRQYGDACDDADPDSYSSTAPEFRSHSFESYASAIDRCEDGTLDLVLVDGRSRPSCVKHASGKVKPGGYLLVDNTERDRYLGAKTLSYLRSYELVLNRFGPAPGVAEFTRATVWKRMR